MWERCWDSFTAEEIATLRSEATMVVHCKPGKAYVKKVDGKNVIVLLISEANNGIDGATISETRLFTWIEDRLDW